MSSEIPGLKELISELTLDIADLRKRLALAENVAEILIAELNDLNEGIRNGSHEADLSKPVTPSAAGL